MTAHDCEWECFDCDAAGCLLCGKLHLCRDGTCKQVVGVEDGTVCVITAFCVRTINFQESEYEDRVISCVQQRNLYSGDSCTALAELVKCYVRELLLSNKARKAYASEVTRVEHRVAMLATRTVTSAQHANRCLISAIQDALSSEVSEGVLRAFDVDERTRLLHTCSRYIIHLITQCQSRLHVKFKPSEMRTISFGLVYMMRYGIHAHGVTILPKLDCVCALLPTESVLQRVFDFRAKNITDVENKFKLILRHVPHTGVVDLGLHDNA